MTWRGFSSTQTAQPGVAPAKRARTNITPFLRGHDETVGWRSDEITIQVFPFGIELVDQPYLPGTWPMLDHFLPLNCVTNVVELFVVDESLKVVSFRKPTDHSLTMLMCTTQKIAADASIENAVMSIGHKVDEAARHPAN
jgi:hypothetical protein